MQELSEEFRRTRELVGSIESRDLRRGFTLTLLLLVAVVWLISLAPLLFIAHRISSPIRQLTAGLTHFAAGQWDRRLEKGRDDEVGRAVDAFNDMAEQLRRSRERLVYLTQMSSWQSLARKTAHELKNSLTPIRLTVEEMLARQPLSDRAFMDQAVQIVVSEIETLERRVRAFSEFASEPPVNPEVFDLNVLIAERVALLKPAHPNTAYTFRLDVRGPRVHAGTDLVKGILTNLLENAAEAAGPGGSVMTVSHSQGGQVVVEVHDSGPGLSAEARRTLFEPTITFKKRGMGLGLSIARKNALLLGGDITLVTGELGGAGFRVALPSAPESRGQATYMTGVVNAE
jgi:nitrogen fixation/metabolism regulation signal transduction histidine kinase